MDLVSASHFCRVHPSSPNPFSLREQGNWNIKVPRPLGEGFRVRATQLGCTRLGESKS